MSSYIDPRFRPTLWPGTVVPTPPIRPFSRVEVDGDWILWPVGSSLGQDPVQLPDDFYLREMMEVPRDDLDAVAHLFRTHGKLFDLAHDDLDLQDDTPAAQLLEALPDPPGSGGPSDPFGVHRDAINLYLDKAQNAVKTLLATRRPGGLEELVEPDVTEAGMAALITYGAEPFASLEEYRDALVAWRIMDLKADMQAALGSFSIGLGELADRGPTIYSVSFLQMYNHLAEHAEFRRCGNETCGRSFVRQRGRAEYGQNRTTGVKYCSRACARAQAQRSLRRRRAGRSEQ